VEFFTVKTFRMDSRLVASRSPTRFKSKMVAGVRLELTTFGL
jgi:hypothetical protein